MSAIGSPARQEPVSHLPVSHLPVSHPPDSGSPVGQWPITQYILKVHSRCDLACDHCYVYEHADQSWRGRPRAMAAGTVRAAAGRIADHAAAHHLPRVTVVLHGGEPLLLGPRGLREMLEILRGRLEPATRLDLRMQSNGVRLSEEFCELLVEYDVRLGISLDGDAAANDRHRRFANGASSHARVLRALAMLRRPRYRRQYAGILCTVDIANDPVAVYRALREQEPPRLDLLLPHATWDHPPVRPDGRATPYADWLLAVYDRWSADGRPMPIRLFDSVRSTAFGGASGNEWVGLDPADLVVIETDGAWEKVDSLKTTYAGAPETGLSVFTHSVDEVAALPDVARRQTGLDGLAAQCRACPVVRQCGGGLFAHRYREGSGFDNPSAYCADLKELMVSLNRRIGAEPAPAPDDRDREDLPAELLERIGSGRTDPDAVRLLAGAQLAIARALITEIGRGRPGATGAGWELLCRLDQEAPAAVEATLRHPYLRVWAVDALRRSEVDPDAGAYLSCVAASAAVHAGVEAALDVPVRAGVVHLPSVGSATLPEPFTGTARLVVGPEDCAIHHDGSVTRVPFDTPRSGGDGGPQGGRDQGDGGGPWQPNRRVSVGGLTLLLEDLDPYRDCHDWKAAERLTAERSARWERSLTGAWRAVERDAPDHVDALRAGLRAVVPLVDDPAGMLRSSTARDAFGSVAAARADDAAMAVMIVHEYQHNILGALLDVQRLFKPGHRERMTVGWRTDPRPVEGVLQGTYAHLAVADMWRRRAGRPGAAAADGQHYERYRAWTAGAAAAMLASGALTPAGERFVGCLAATLRSWPA